MPQPEFQLPILLDYVATFLWALSGAIVGMHKRYDVSGVLVIALLASTGGGLIRDGLFLQQKPPVLQDGLYIPIVVAAVLVVILLRTRIARMPLVDHLISLIDAVGVPAFAIVGMQLSLRAGVPLSGVILVGVVNGFGGGLLRDVVVGDTPAMLKPGRYAVSALLLTCVVFLFLVRGLQINQAIAAWSCIGLFFAIRMLALRYNLRTRPLLLDPPLVTPAPINDRQDN